MGSKPILGGATVSIAGEYPCAFAGTKFAPVPGWQTFEIEFADSYADQSERGVADCGGHPADLVVFSLGQ